MPILEYASEYGWAFELPGFLESSAEPENRWWLVSKKMPGFLGKGLCGNCKWLDFNRLFNTVLKETLFQWKGKDIRLAHGIRLGTLDQIENNKKCRFCCLVWQTFCSGSEEIVSTVEGLSVDFWLDNFAISNEGRTTLKTHPLRKGPAIVQLEISVREWEPQNGRLEGLARRLWVFKIQQTPTPNHAPGPSLPVEPANNQSPEFWRLIKWVDSCEGARQQKSFIGAKMSSMDIHEKLELWSRVIDIHRRRIVKAPSGCRYVALSYVWGATSFSLLTEDNFDDFEQDGSVDFVRVPRTIRDAVSLCRELGERYLWVDSMCIIQGTEDKHNQIKSMEAIYRGATLTLVAAAEDNAEAGLPYFNTKPFAFRQHSASVQGLSLANVSPDFKTSVDLSVWNTRAWTYQERLLSRRLIIFTKDQIYFQCDHGTAQGDSGLEPHDPTYIKYLADDAKDEAYRLEMKRKVNLNIYAQMVQEYTNRRLSYASDIENAFGGINKVVSLLFGGSEVLFGIPISSLAIALLWESNGVLKRRSDDAIAADAEKSSRNQRTHPLDFMGRGDISITVSSGERTWEGQINVFPSWAWMGWIGSVKFPDIKNLSERNIFTVDWLDPLNTLKNLPQENFGPPPTNWDRRSDWLRQITLDGQVYYTPRGSDGQNWFCHPMAPFIHNPIPINRDTGTLHLRANVANFEIRSKGMQRFSIRDKQGARAGKITMDGHSSGSPAPNTCTLIRLSQTTLMEGFEDPAWDFKTAQYLGKPGGPPINPNMITSRAEELFDTSVYDPTLCWCLYNVLVVETTAKVARRIGIGKVHINAFDLVAEQGQVIELY